MLVENVIPAQKADDRRLAGSNCFEECRYLRVRCDDRTLTQDVKGFYLVAGEKENPPQIEEMVSYVRLFLDRLAAETYPLLNLAALQSNAVA